MLFPLRSWTTAQTIQLGCGGHPAILMVFLPVRALTPLTPVGLGGAAGIPPQAAQVPTQRIAAALAERSLTACWKVTSTPLRLHARHAFPPNFVGMPPSTARM